MLDKLGSAYLRSKIWLKCKVEDFKENEMGVSGIVATIVLVAITLILVGIFWDKISGIVKTWFGQITDNSTIDPQKAGGK